MAKALDFQLQHHSFQRTPRTDLLQNGLVGSPCSPRDSQESSPTPQFKSINSLALSLLHSPYVTTGKIIALTRRTFVGKVMSLLLNMPSRLVITFLLRSKHLLISWLQSPSVVILEPKKMKSVTVSIVHFHVPVGNLDVFGKILLRSFAHFKTALFVGIFALELYNFSLYFG